MDYALIENQELPELNFRRQVSIHIETVKVLVDMGFNPEFVERIMSYTQLTEVEDLLPQLIEGPDGWNHEFLRKF